VGQCNDENNPLDFGMYLCISGPAAVAVPGSLSGTIVENEGLSPSGVLIRK
jgi:hypothetical protein